MEGQCRRKKGTCQVRMGRSRGLKAERRLCFWSSERGRRARQGEGPGGPSRLASSAPMSSLIASPQVPSRGLGARWRGMPCSVASASAGVRSPQFRLVLSIGCGVAVWAPVRVQVQARGVLQS